MSGFVNSFDYSDYANKIISAGYFGGDYLCDPVWSYKAHDLENGAKAFTASNLLPPSIVSVLLDGLRRNAWQAVGLDGYANKPYEQIGNFRLSNFNEAFADVLWRRLKPFLPDVRVCDPFTPTDHDNHSLWRPIGVNPLMRFIRYEDGGQLVAHYDGTYAKTETQRTLMSLVIYLTTNEYGATRFLRDPQVGKRMDEMDFSDWDRAGHDDEVIFANKPRAGHALLFDHRLLHDGEPFQQGSQEWDKEKIIIRTDIVFERA
jgi:hypothetical protein